MSKILIALGGNALGENNIEQQKLVSYAAKSLVNLIKEGHDLVICHGNGPQVGMIHQNLKKENMPLQECTAMSQGYIGYHLQKAIFNELKKNNIEKSVLSVITQVEVDKNDLAFNNPTKPIGNFYNKIEADEIEKKFNYIMKEDAGRGYRRVVPSPKPKDIIEKDQILKLINGNTIIIASGGGGIPVINNDGQINGIEAVIDKDATAALMSDLLDVDIFLILTAIDYVMINYGKENQEKLEVINILEAKDYINQNQFHKGSMLPKIEAAIDFVSKKDDRVCIITALENALDALEGKIGTRIVNNVKCI